MRALLMCVALAILSGCVFGPPSRELEVGMTLAEVRAAEGAPAWAWYEGAERVEVYQFNGHDVLRVRYTGKPVAVQIGEGRHQIFIEWRVASFRRVMSGYR